MQHLIQNSQNRDVLSYVGRDLALRSELAPQ